MNKSVHTGPKIQPGGLKEGLLLLAYQLPEDFIVKENSNVELVEKGECIIFILKKKNYTTERAVQQIADALHLDRKRIGYGGNMDSKSVTEQSISIKGAGREK